jgi:hypothetical protein
MGLVASSCPPPPPPPPPPPHPAIIKRLRININTKEVDRDLNPNIRRLSFGFIFLLRFTSATNGLKTNITP